MKHLVSMSPWSFRNKNRLTNSSKINDLTYERGKLSLAVLLCVVLLSSTDLMAETYYSQGNGLVNSTSSWNTLAGGGGAVPDDFTGTHTWIIRPGDEMTMSGDWIVGGTAEVIINGVLTVSSIHIVAITGTLTVNGSLINSGTHLSDAVTATGGITVIGTYEHARDGGNALRATWSDGSLCLVTGWTGTSTLNSSFDQTFYNFTWNCPGQTGLISFAGYVTPVIGTFTLENSGFDVEVANPYHIAPGGNPTYANYNQTGGIYNVTLASTLEEMVFHVTNDFNLSHGNFYQSTRAKTTLIVDNDLNHSGGIFYMSRDLDRGSTATVRGDFNLSGEGGFIVATLQGNGSLTIEGDFNMSSGNCQLQISNDPAGNGTVYVAGNFTHTSGYILENNSSNPGTLVFNGTGIQTYTSGPQGSFYGNIDIVVGSDTRHPVLQMGTGLSPAVIGSGSSGTFTLLAGATLGITSVDGITTAGATGNIRVSGTRTFSQDANYIYNGTSPQATGDGLPVTVSNLTLDNAVGAITFNSPRNVTNIFSISYGSKANLGSFTHSAGLLMLGGVGQPNGSYGHPSSPASFPNDTYFEDATGVVNNPVDTWLGGSSAWNDDLNWSGGVPDFGTNIVIISSAAYQPVISSVTIADCRNLSINPGASLTIESTGVTSTGSLIVHGTGVGILTFNRYLRPENNRGERHFFSSPVEGQSIGSFITGNTSGEPPSSKVAGLWEWSELNGEWPEISLSAGSFMPGKGYNLAQASGNDGMYTFTGTLATTLSITATAPYNSEAQHYNNERGIWGGGGWNLLGNPFTSSMRVTDEDLDGDDGNNENDFLGRNLNSFDPSYQAVYIYDGTVGEHGTYYYIAKPVPFADPITGDDPAFTDFESKYVQAGQGFYVLANYDDVTFSFTREMQAHNTGVTMTKSAKTEESWPGMHLKVKSGESESYTTVVYNGNMSLGLDPGYDVGQLSSGQDVSLYTTLAEKDNSVNFSRQALPVEDSDKTVIKVGIDSEGGGEMTFSAYTVPIGNKKFWLEDRVTGIFTDLTTKSYNVILPAKTYGTGRFFIIASANTPSGIKQPKTNDDTGIRIWTSKNSVIIKGSVSERATCEIYGLEGQMISKTILDDGVVNTVTLPAGSSGFYIVRVIDGDKVTIRKITMLQ